MKYPRTWHFPYSPGHNADEDDKVLVNTDRFEGMDLIYLEKMDGECTICSNDSCHARSEDSKMTPWRTYMARMHGCFRHNIPDGMFVCGECMYAIHSITYTSLPTCFFVFGIFYHDEWLRWEDVLYWADLLGLDTVPEICKSTGVIHNMPIPNKSTFGPVCEGYVARNVESFSWDFFCFNVAKCVRKHHVQTQEHWTKTWEPASFVEDPITRMYNRLSCQNHQTKSSSFSGLLNAPVPTD